MLISACDSFEVFSKQFLWGLEPIWSVVFSQGILTPFLYFLSTFYYLFLRFAFWHFATVWHLAPSEAFHLIVSAILFYSPFVFVRSLHRIAVGLLGLILTFGFTLYFVIFLYSLIVRYIFVWLIYYISICFWYQIFCIY